MLARIVVWTLAGILTVGLAGCESSKETPQEKKAKEQAEAKDLAAKASDAIKEFKTADPSMKKFFDSSYGYAVYPEIAKGGLVVGGASGEGLVYQQGKKIGKSVLKQATIGAQIGGQTYSEIIFFKNKEALDAFTKGDFELSAQASAVAAKSGASTDVDYESGVAIFTHSTAGLMAEASVGGQKFDFTAEK